MSKEKHLPVAAASLPQGSGRGDQQGRLHEHQSVRHDGRREKVAAMKTAELFNAPGAEADIEAARRLLRRDGGQPPEPDDALDQPDP